MRGWACFNELPRWCSVSFTDQLSLVAGPTGGGCCQREERHGAEALHHPAEGTTQHKHTQTWCARDDWAVLSPGFIGVMAVRLALRTFLQSFFPLKTIRGTLLGSDRTYFFLPHSQVCLSPMFVCCSPAWNSLCGHSGAKTASCRESPWKPCETILGKGSFEPTIDPASVIWLNAVVLRPRM